jgi:broad specificity phosphatase PhoE
METTMPSKNSVSIIYVRHGSTRLNQANQTSTECLRGHLDVKLSDKGRDEANKVASELADKKFDVIVTSDLSRAADTAKAISKASGVPIAEITSGLRPWHVGRYAGVPMPNCNEWLTNYVRDKPDERLEGGESFNDFKTRFLDCIDDIRRKYAGKVVCVVSHSRGERLLQSWKETGGDLSETVEPTAFLRQGIGPGEWRDDLVLGEGDREEEAESKSAKSAPRQSKSDAPWNSQRIEPRPSSGGGKGIFSKPVGDAGNGLARDPLDLAPDVPLKRTSQSWASTVLQPLRKGE